VLVDDKAYFGGGALKQVPTPCTFRRTTWSACTNSSRSHAAPSPQGIRHHEGMAPDSRGASFHVSGTVRCSRIVFGHAGVSPPCRPQPRPHHSTAQVWDVVSDFQVIADSLGLRPTRLQELVPVSRPHYIGASDACQLGMGGVWFDLSGVNPPML
jgi:hypothetical protein